MLPANLTEAQIYRHVHQLLNDHERMLADSVRNQAFLQALQAHVHADSVVLDIGAGFGVWAITAAKLGAKKVVAVDSNELLLGAIKKLAEQCGVADRVDAICGYSTDLDLPREFDIVVSETIGFDGFDESIVAVMSDARQRFLKPSGVLIPASLSLWCAAVHCPEKPLLQATPLAFDHFTALNRHAPVRLREGETMNLLSPPRPLISTDLYQAQEPIDLTQLHASWQFDQAQKINAVLVWVQSDLSHAVQLSTRDTSSWTPLLYRFDSGQKDLQSLAFQLAFVPDAVHWSVTCTGQDWQETKQYSPKFATQQLLQDLRRGDLQVSALGAQLIDALLPS